MRIVCCRWYNAVLTTQYPPYHPFTPWFKGLIECIHLLEREIACFICFNTAVRHRSATDVPTQEHDTYPTCPTQVLNSKQSLYLSCNSTFL